MARRHLISGLILTFLGASIAPAQAQTDLSKFPLAKTVPADVFILVAGRHNAERKFLEDHWARVWKAVHESGIGTDIWEMVSDAMSDEQAEQVDTLSKQFGDLWSAIDWNAFFGTETVHAGRYVMPFTGSPYEGVLMGRCDPAKAEANYLAIKAILTELAKLIESKGGAGAVTVTETERDGLKLTVFGPASVPNLGLAVAAKKDVLFLGFGGLSLMEDCARHLSGSSQTKTLASTERFKSAFGKLPPAEDEIFFFDLNNMLGQLKGMMGMMAGNGGAGSKSHAAAPKAKAGKKPKAEDDADKDADDDDDDKPAPKPKAKSQRKHAKPTDEEGNESSNPDDEDSGAAILALIPKVFDEISIFDYVAAVEWTEGHSVHKESLCALKTDAKGKALYDALTGGKPIANYEKWIPQEAKSFSVGSGINWSRLYTGVREFYADNFPGAKQNLEEFDSMQKDQWEIDIDKDVLSLLAGGHISFELGNDHVSMLKVTDEEKAQAQITRLFDMLGEKIGKDSGLMLSKTEIAGHKGFYQVSHPMLMMMGGITPVCGCADGYLFIATSPKSVRICLETAKGTHPNITKNEQFKTQGIMPKSGTPTGISFEDQSGLAEQIQQAVGGISMAMGFVGLAPDLPDGVKSTVAKLQPVVAKLQPVAGKLDFFVSSGSYETLEGTVWHKREVQNYKGPRAAGEDDEDKDKTEVGEKPMKKKSQTTVAPKKKPKPKKEEDDE
ncbi:MAG TPA: hypothetical protein VMV81_03260 [Phycisphaerae bacterium]|nr:hypothetical protein [Phycisphaerae bacterium]